MFYHTCAESEIMKNALYLGFLVSISIHVIESFHCNDVGNMTLEDDATKLFKHLCARVNRFTFPKFDKGPLKLQVENYVVRIKEMTWWTDVTKWKPKEFGGMQKIAVPRTFVWVPEMVYFNSKSTKYERTKPILYFDGKVVLKQRTEVNTACTFDVRWFPFDQHSCYIEMGPWYTDRAYIRLNEKTSGMSLLHFQPNLEWHLEKFRTDLVITAPFNKTYKYQLLRFHIYVGHNPLYFYYIFVVPSILLSMLTILTFITPSNSAEKLNLGLSVLLSYTMFILQVADTMPTDTDNVPLLARYLELSQIFCVISICLATGVSYLYHQSHHSRQIPLWLKKPVFCIDDNLFEINKSRNKISSRDVLERRRRRLENMNNDNNVILEGVMHTAIDTKCHLLHHHKKTLFGHPLEADREIRIKQAVALQRVREREAEEWKIIADILDRFLFYVYGISLLVMTALILSYHSEDYDLHEDWQKTPTKNVEKVLFGDSLFNYREFEIKKIPGGILD